MQKTSIIILSYNTYVYTKLCIESIRRFTKSGTYEIIVVDNASTDESISWLKKQKDIRVIYNKKNEGFPKGCNQGMEIASGSEILLLNSDTVVTPSWLDNLLYALYSDEKVGAVGCVTNYSSNFQKIVTSYTSLDEMFVFAEKYNHKNSKKWEKTLTLVGFCFLMKRAVYDKIGLLDEQFSPGNYEDEDYSLRIWQAGYRLLLCRDTFIHHFGNMSFIKSVSPDEEVQKRKNYNALLQRNFTYFKKKWNLSDHYKQFHPLLLDLSMGIKLGMRILMSDCGSGMDLFLLARKYPQAEISGITYCEADANIAGAGFPVVFCKREKEEFLNHLSGKYDFILLTEEVGQFLLQGDSVARIKDFLSLQGKIYLEKNGKISEIGVAPLVEEKMRKIYADKDPKSVVITMGSASSFLDEDIRSSRFGCHVLAGRYCSFGKNISFGAEGEPMQGNVSTYNFHGTCRDGYKPFSANEQILVGNDVWIGNDVKIAAGVRIGNGAILRTGAVITEDIPAYAVVNGNPAKVIEYRFGDEDIYRLQRIKWWNWSYGAIKEALPFMKDVDRFIATFYREEIVQEQTETARTLKLLRHNGYCIYGFLPDFGVSSAVWRTVIQQYLDRYTQMDKTAMVLDIPSEEKFPLEYEQLFSFVESRGDDAPLVLTHERTKRIALDIVQNIDCFLTSREEIASRYMDYADGYGIRVVSGLKKDIFSD